MDKQGTHAERDPAAPSPANLALSPALLRSKGARQSSLRVASNQAAAHLLLQLFDWFMRGVMGELERLVVDSMPAGEIGNMIFVPLVAVALWFSLLKAADRGAATD